MSFIKNIQPDLLQEKIDKTHRMLESCSLCPRRCGVNRLKKEYGYCRMGLKIVISSCGPHFGEEPELVGNRGSGTIFLTGCNLGCIYCQNYEISIKKQGRETSESKLSDVMLYLQDLGCHNINFVTPTHFVPQILESLLLAKKRGLDLPLVYNCGGYESAEVLGIIDGVFDIYMPDAKYADGESAKKYSSAPDYPQIIKEVLRCMHTQVGDFKVDASGLAVKGLLIRHLILPGESANTKEIIKFIAKEISKNTYINIMNQYRPCHNAYNYKEISRYITEDEYSQAIRDARGEGLHRGF